MMLADSQDGGDTATSPSPEVVAPIIENASVAAAATTATHDTSRSMRNGFLWRARQLLRRQRSPGELPQHQSQDTKHNVLPPITPPSLPLIPTVSSLLPQSEHCSASTGSILNAAAAAAEEGETVRYGTSTRDGLGGLRTKPAHSDSTSTRPSWKSKARSFFGRGGMTIEADNHALFYQPAISSGEKSHVKLPAIHHCHICQASFDHERLCLNCRHKRCQDCISSALQKRKRDNYTDSDEESSRITSKASADNRQAAWQLERQVVTNNLQIARTCHQCRTQFVLFEKICQICKHIRCSKCPRSFPSSMDRPPDMATYNPPSYRLPERIYKRPKIRVKYTCENCSTLFRENCIACTNCGHQRCRRCIRDPPRKHPPQMASIDSIAIHGLSTRAASRIPKHPSPSTSCLPSCNLSTNPGVSSGFPDKHADLDVADGLPLNLSKGLSDVREETSHAEFAAADNVSPNPPRSAPSLRRPFLSAAALSLLDARIAQIEEEEEEGKDEAEMNRSVSVDFAEQNQSSWADCNITDAWLPSVTGDTAEGPSPRFSTSRLSLPFRNLM